MRIIIQLYIMIITRENGKSFRYDFYVRLLLFFYRIRDTISLRVGTIHYTHA